jgi:hypothetical protein
MLKIIKLQIDKPRNTVLGAIAAFTVVELLIALLLAAIITSASLALYITQQKQLIVQSDISDMQGSLRAAASELGTKIRMAGYKLPDGFPCIVAHNTNPDTIEIIANALSMDGFRIEHAMPMPSSELRCDGHDISALHSGDTLYIYDPTTMSGEFFTASEIQVASSNIQHNTDELSRCYPQGSLIFKVTSFKYFIDSTDPLHPNFMYMQGGGPAQIYAENISSLNLQYVLSSGAIVDQPTLTYMVREVLINIVGITSKADNEFFTPYRNRSLTTRVKIRNLGDNS